MDVQAMLFFFFFKLFPVLKVVSLRFHTNFVNIHKRTFENTFSSLNLLFQAIYDLKTPGIHLDNLHDNFNSLR